MGRKELERIINIVNNAKITDEQRQKYNISYMQGIGFSILKANIIKELNKLETD